MSVCELLERVDSRELTEWELLYQIKAEERELHQEGLSPEEITDAIENRGARQRGGVEDEFVDRLIGEERVAERQRLLLELEDDEDDEDDG